MGDGVVPAKVDDDEKLARFIYFPIHFRQSDKTVKPGAFDPPANLKLSVHRHKGLTEKNLKKRGLDVAKKKKRPLLGRADIIARDVRKQRLTIIQSGQNPNHADIEDWPQEKSKRKSITLELARRSTFISYEV